MWKLALALLLPAQAQAQACGVALALVIDVSGSINDGEYHMQMQGLADAILDSTVRDAMVDAQVALTVIQWSGGSRQKISVPWAIMRDAGELARFAQAARTAPREWFASHTAVGSAMKFAGEYFAEAPVCERRVIDVSGDGPSNGGPLTWEVRDDLVAKGFIINGIAIEDAIVNVTDFYNANVKGGHGSFVLTATGYDDYPRAIKRKLINEVTKPAS